MIVSILDYSLSNLYSIKNFLIKNNYTSIITREYKTIINSDALILPGVGSFKYAMRQINKFGINDIVLDFIKTGKPVIGICLGFQLLFEKSEEFGNCKGLAVLEGKVKYFKKKINHKLPYIGWNEVNFTKKKKKEFFYFIHSCYVKPKDKRIIASNSKFYGFNFCSSVIRENIFGFQFHPEKSGPSGDKLIKSILK